MENSISNIWAITLALLRSVVVDKPLPDGFVRALTAEQIASVYQIACRFDLAHLIAIPLTADETLKGDRAVEPFRQSMYRAVNRYVQMDYEIGRIGEAFDREKIPYIPLKGAAMRQYYPEPWMRTSCDVDILVHTEDTERASAFLIQSLSYVQTGRTPHDISFKAPGNVHIELHHGLVESDRAARASEILAGVWENAATADNTCRWVMSDEMFYFYHIAHMTKHFENGGCGVRPFIDLWILNHKLTFDRAKRESLLRDGGLLKFAEGCKSLSEVWFGEAEPDELTDRLEQYVLGGGMYGNIENMVAVQKNQDGGRIRYIFKRLFMPYEKLKNVYPILQRHKWLTPVMGVRRWYDMIATGRMNRTVRELQSLKSDGGDSGIARLLRELELNGN